MTGQASASSVYGSSPSLLEQVQGFAQWIAAGRKLTQTRRLTMTDARVLVPLLGTGDRVDPVIGDRRFRTPSSRELVRLNLLFEWSKAAGLTRVVSGRLVPVKKNAKLLADPDALRTVLSESFAKVPADAVVPSQWITSLVLEALPEACAVLRSVLGFAGGTDLEMLQNAVWADLTGRFVLDNLDPGQMTRLHEATDRDVAILVALWAELGMVRHDKGRIHLDKNTPAMPSTTHDSDTSADQLFQLRVVLQDTEPEVWRRLLVPSSIRLDRLHGVLQAALGWTDSHLHLFTLGDTRYGWRDPDFGEGVIPEHTVRLADIATEGTVIGYEYDFGDGWEHTVLIEAVSSPDSAMPHLRCIEGSNACPPEDCGGPWGYHDLRETLANPAAEEHREMLDWLGIDNGSQFDATAFDLNAANRRITADQRRRSTH
ncbi:plasmid pRiA4b ORF-3 family protein [Catenulispora sp. NF23]|uniref:Plasmid pRiA4b ORF-3 family protein n=1 Tax=Catenulispora pinistramenti TaxID=2705254 RepID=A0ABS5KGQ4_9ACTN|nr:plasmid pRiA4b ORF-3 family protein [Catenulispora pinistramenti]MBS2532208.1 plasmid pRiA4b ORF-3 family protein [Catenulispora pinistramenti]MBS2545478.1 plasmid pRiA4b ORF-3 family protein [Catenulispora pinistramenti]